MRNCQYLIKVEKLGVNWSIFYKHFLINSIRLWENLAVDTNFVLLLAIRMTNWIPSLFFSDYSSIYDRLN